MRYANIIPHWYRVEDTCILIDQRYKLIGHFKKVGNQMHREHIRQAHIDTQDQIEINIRRSHK